MDQMNRTLTALAVAFGLALSTGIAAAAPQWISPDYRVRPSDEAAVREAMTMNFKDPASVIFRTGFFSNAMSADGATVIFRTYCGEVNAKNAYGAYVGFQRFIFDGNALFTGEPHEPQISLRWGNLCNNPVQLSRETVEVPTSRNLKDLLLECTRLQDSLLRLNCFDAVAKSAK